MPVTQKDIAEAMGVSQTIVSDVLQGRPRGRVSAETRRNILETARRLGYRTNTYARALRTRQTRQVAYLMTEADIRQHCALGELALSAMASALGRQQYQLLIKTIPSQEDALPALQDLLDGGLCDGALIRVLEADPWDWPALKRLGRPVLILGHCPDPELPSLAFHIRGNVETALGYLAGRGHRRVGLVTTGGLVDYYRKIRGSWEELAPAYGFDPRRWVGAARERPEGEALAQRWLSEPEAPTAVLCVKDRAAVGVTAAALRAGRRVGRDFDLVVFGDPIFGDPVFAWVYEPGTWYFGKDQESVGRRAAEEMASLLEGRPSPGKIRVSPGLLQVGMQEEVVRP